MRRTRLILTGLVTGLLAACGGGSDGPQNAALSGVAAVGAPLVGATVQLRCATPATLPTVLTGASGAWSVSVPAGALPCAVQARGGTANGAPNALQLHALATAAGTTNLTPLTNLVVGLAAGADPSTWFASAGASQLAAASTGLAAGITRALAALRGAGFAVPAGLDPLGGSFAATASDPYDQLLDALAAALAGAASSQPALLASWIAAGAGALPTPAPVASTGGAGSSSGGSSSGGGSAGNGEGAALAGGNGATATFGSTAYTYTANVGWLRSLVNNTGFFSAFQASGASFDALTRWDIRGVPASPGSYSCGGANGTSIQLTVQGRPYSTGVSGGNCTIEVLDVTANYVTGRFSAVLPTLGETTNGYFRLAAATGTPVQGAGQAGGSFQLAGTTYNYATASPLGFETYAGVNLKPVESNSPGAPVGVQIHTVPNAPGTYACGSGDSYRALNIWFWWNGKFHYAGSRQSLNGAGPAGSSCTVTVETASGTPQGTSAESYQNGTFAGTFSGTFVSSDGSSTLNVTNGRFRFNHPR